MKSKPQLCLLNVGLYPPDYVLENPEENPDYRHAPRVKKNTIYHHPFDYNDASFEVLEQSPVLKPVNVLVLEIDTKIRKDMQQHNELYWWVVSLSTGYFQKWNHEMVKSVFILLETTTFKTETCILSRILPPKVITIDLNSKVQTHEISSKL